MSWREREFHLLPSSPFSPLEKKRQESSQLSFLPLFFFMPLTSSLVNKKKTKKKRRNGPKDFSPVFFLMQFKIRLERR